MSHTQQAVCMGTEVVLQAMRESGYTPTAIGIVHLCTMCCVRRMLMY
jgi:hypothetical protein